MINVDVKHNVDLKKATVMTVILGATIGATAVITKEGIEYAKEKINKNKKEKHDAK